MYHQISLIPIFLCLHGVVCNFLASWTVVYYVLLTLIVAFSVHEEVGIYIQVSEVLSVRISNPASQIIVTIGYEAIVFVVQNVTDG